MNNITLISDQIGSKLKEIISSKRLSQKDIVNLCKKKNIKISQATISNALNKPESMSLSTLIKICNGLDIYIPDLLSADPLESIDNIKSAFILDSTDDAYSGYLGNFHVYFLPTTNTSSKLVHGNLSFSHDPGTNRCNAIMDLDTGGQTSNNEPILKHYTGNMVISLRQHCAYCTLISKKLGEICLFVFEHDYLNNNSLYCTMANAVTSSAGRFRQPTVHRICLSSYELNDDAARLLVGELLMINDKFFISEKKLDNFFKLNSISTDFRKKIENLINQPTNRYYMLSEKSLQTPLSTTELSSAEYEFARNISLLKSYSEAAPNNKITMETENILFNLLKGLAKENS
ncbi:MAG: helix-turn-helix transcriptional regulator [Lachnospiraceae bacterium]|jgi:transcriptional regulator with XRE-family HTH domain|nr:helix-turn-helix transcriptional regulator [Lachnospiraceae bacterium]